jgi:hypothetical protein
MQKARENSLTQRFARHCTRKNTADWNLFGKVKSPCPSDELSFSFSGIGPLYQGQYDLEGAIITVTTHSSLEHCVAVDIHVL